MDVRRWYFFLHCMCLDQHWSVHWYLLQGTFALFVPCFSLWVTTTNHHSKHWKHNHQPSNILSQCNEAQAMWQPENVTLWQSDYVTSSRFVKKSMLSFENCNRKRSNRKCDTLRKCTAGHTWYLSHVLVLGSVFILLSWVGIRFNARQACSAQCHIFCLIVFDYNFQMITYFS